MKSLFLLLVISVSSFWTVHAQATLTREVIPAEEVPMLVTNTHEVHFSGIAVDRWEKFTGTKGEKSGVKYVAVFKQDGQRIRARYWENGTGRSATTYYAGKKLPQAIQDAAAENFPDFQLKSGEKIQSLQDVSKEVYRIRLRKGAQKLVVFVDENGVEIQKNKVPEEISEAPETEQ